MHKTFEDEVLRLICDAEQTANALFLRMTIDELLTTAVFETVATITKTCLACKDARKLCDLVLARYEADYGAAFVQRGFSFIVASRYGVSEPELLELLEAPADMWSPFYLATRELLCSTGGLLNLANSQMTLAIEARYLAKPHARSLVHAELLKFFGGVSTEVVTPHRMREEAPPTGRASEPWARSHRPHRHHWSWSPIHAAAGQVRRAPPPLLQPIQPCRALPPPPPPPPRRMQSRVAPERSWLRQGSPRWPWRARVPRPCPPQSRVAVLACCARRTFFSINHNCNYCSYKY